MFATEDVEYLKVLIVSYKLVANWQCVPDEIK